MVDGGVGCRRLLRIISHIRFEDLPIEFILEIAIPKRIGKMRSHITREIVRDFLGEVNL